MPDFCSYGDAHFTLLKERPSASTMSLPSRMASAFQGCKSLKTVSLGSELRSVGKLGL